MGPHMAKPHASASPRRPSVGPAAGKLEAIFGKVPDLPPVAAALGAEVIDVDKGSATLAMQTDRSFHNPVSVVHGSILTALAELAVCLAITTVLDQGEVFTITGMQTNFLAPVVEGRVTATATVTRRGRTISYVDADVRLDGHDEPVCRVMATCYHRRLR